MSSDIENLESIYSRLYEISLQISQLIERELYTELVTYLAKKERLLNEAKIYIERLKNNSEINTENLAQICNKYQLQEKQNINALTLLKEDIRKELSKTTKSKNLLGAYSTNKEYIYGSILDYSE